MLAEELGRESTGKRVSERQRSSPWDPRIEAADSLSRTSSLGIGIDLPGRLTPTSPFWLSRSLTG